MRLRIAILSILVLVLAGVLWFSGQRHGPVEYESTTSRRAPAATASTAFDWHPVHSYAEARAMLRAAYRLAPDHRFLGAVADVPRLAGAPATGTAAARWTGEHWLVTCGAESVGTLPEYPSYADARALLAPWAARWARETRAVPGKDMSPPATPDPFGSLAALDTRWRAGDRGPAVQAAGSEALAWLVFANAGDRTRQSDGIAGRALAAAALANAEDTPTLRTHVMLARVFGYAREAGALAAGLPERDPRRAWAMRDTAALSRLAATAGEHTEAVLFRMYALAEDGRREAWLDAYASDLPASPALEHLGAATGQLLRSFEIGPSLARWTLYATTLETQRWTHADTAAVVRVLMGRDIPRGFETLLLSGGALPGGPLLDATVVRGHARAQVYTALTEYGLHQVRSLFSESASRAFGDQLGEPGNDPAGEFARWYTDLVEGTWPAHDGAAPLAADLDSLGTLGAEQLQYTFEAAVKPPGAERPALTRGMVHHLDTRPADRMWLAWVSVGTDLALEGRDDLLAASASAGGPDGAAAEMWLAAQRGDDAALVRLMGSPDVAIDSKTTLLSLLKGAEQPFARFQRCAAAATAAHPSSSDLVLEWAEGLEEHGDSEHARRVLETWLDRDSPEESALAIGDVIARDARYFREAGMPQRAWAILSRDSTSKFAVLAEQALTLDALGKSDAAMRIAKGAMKRYHGESGPSGVLARLYWAHGRDTLAAEALLDTKNDPNFWRWQLGPQFVRDFRGRPAAALAAVRVLAARLGPERMVLQNLGAAYAAAGDPGTGFEVVRSCMGGGMNRVFDLPEAYGLAKQAHGREQALAWLATVPAPQPLLRRMALETGVAGGHDELAWLESLPDDPRERDFDLLVRAPGVAFAAANDPHRALMRQELHGRQGSYYLDLARFVAEGGDVDSVMRHTREPGGTAEVFYWIGRRAELEGREADAAACYQLCLETGARREGEWYWAAKRLRPLLNPLRTLRESSAPATVAMRNRPS